MGLLGDMVVRIVGDTADFIRDVDLAGRKLSQFEKDTKTLMRGLQTAGRQMTMYVTAPIVAMAAGAVKAAADFEQQRVAFETLLGSAEKAAPLLKDIEEFSAATPFQMPDLLDGAKRLLGFGTEADKVVDTLRMLGDASMGNQETLTRLVDSFGKVQAKGKASLEEINRFSEAGVPLIAQLAENLGVTNTELFEMVRKGTVGIKDIEAALVSLTTGTGKFAGMTEKQSQTMLGLFSTMKDNIVLLAKTIGEDLLPWLKTVVQNVTDFVKRFRDMDEGTRRFIMTVAGIAAAVGPVLLVIAQVIGAIHKIGVAIKLVSALMNASIAGTPIGLILLAVAALAAATILIIQNWDAIKEFFINLWAKVKEIFIKAWEAIKAFLLENWPYLTSLILGPFGILLGLIIKNWDDIVLAFQNAFQRVREIVERIKAVVMEKLQPIIDIMQKIADGVSGVWERLKDKLVGKSIIPDMVNAIRDWFRYMKEGVTEETEEAAANSLSTFERMFKDLTGRAQNFIGAVGGLWDAYYENLLSNESLTDEQRKKYMREQAKAQKTMALFQAIINTARAIVEALPNIPLAILAGVTGAIQIATIAATPLPKLAKGGKLTRPTMVMAGEAGPEYFIPELQLDELGGRIAEAMHNARITNTIVNDQPIQLSIKLGGRELDAYVQEAISNRRILVRQGAVTQ